MIWQRVASLVRTRPGWILGISLALLAAPAMALPSLQLSFDLTRELPPESDSVQGIELLDRSFGAGQVQPVVVIVRSREDMWTDPAFAAIDDLTVNLEKVAGVSDVRSVTRPAEGGVSQAQLESLGLGGVSELTDRLPRATEGLGRAIEGLRRIRAGLEQIRASVPSQQAQVRKAVAGVDAMRDGAARLRSGIDRLLEGTEQLRGGLARAESGLRDLANRVAGPTLENLQAAWDDLRGTTVGKVDPQYDDLARHVGTALAAVSGRCPDTTGVGPQPADCPAGKRVAPGYDGLRPTLLELAAGLNRAVHGIDRLNEGLQALDTGLGRLDGGLARLETGLAGSTGRLDRLRSGTGRMIDGLDRIVPGLEQLRQGLAVGTALIQDAGLVPDPDDEVAVTASLATAFPKLRDQLSFFTGDRGRATRLYVTLQTSAYEAPSMTATRRIRDLSRLSLRDTPLQKADVFVTGAAPFFTDVADVSERDLPTVLIAVVLGILAVLALLLRSAVAPLYLVATVLLSFAATLGLTVAVFQGLLGAPGLVWWLPIFLFVILVALGADYNIFLVGRIREEAERMPTRLAVVRGLSATGHVITSAGLILAGTFAALLMAPLGGMVQMGFAATVGILVDTFLVRSLLVPSIAMLVGPASWWPSARASRP
jgi:RND superfamily putative drug exporter